jgi:hypothetical protein
MKLTISMATFNDYDGLYFTIQAIRTYHKLPANVEFLVLDNNPGSSHSAAIEHLLKSVPNSRYIPIGGKPSSWVKYEAFKHATGDIILGLDCHVLLAPRFFGRLKTFFQNNANRLNMLTGPVVFNNLRTIATSMNPVWNKHDFGVWMRQDLSKGYAEVQMQGMGCFAIRKDAWVDIPSTFSGFGAEEWFMAEHVRRWGGKVISHPQMRWVHRFKWPKREFPLLLDDKVRNYYTGWFNLYGQDHPMIEDMTKHWKTQIPEERLNRLIDEAKVLVTP